MKAGWQTKRLDEICVLVNGRAYKKDELLGAGKYPVLRVGNFFTSDHWYHSDLELEADKYCDNGDLLYAWSASFGPRIWGGDKVIYHYHIWKVLPNEVCWQ
jgi:type I restriction enzyme, S subunit